MFAWRYLDSDGNEIGASHRFEDRAAAEEWLGEVWSALAAQGIEQVELVGDEAVVYRMGLAGETA